MAVRKGCGLFLTHRQFWLPSRLKTAQGSRPVAMLFRTAGRHLIQDAQGRGRGRGPGGSFHVTLLAYIPEPRNYAGFGLP